MNRLNIYLLLLLGVLILYAHSAFAQFDGVTINPQPTAFPTNTPTPTPTLPPPAFFSIPKIGVDAPVEPVGVDEEGTMQLPYASEKVGWYSPGYRPGEPGNAVFAGHLDSTTGEGAIFYNLGQLEAGDEIMVSDIEGRIYTYIVVRKEIYEYDKAPIVEIFGDRKEKYLNLITCTGAWNPYELNYSHRMVIYSELKEDL